MNTESQQPLILAKPFVFLLFVMSYFVFVNGTDLIQFWLEVDSNIEQSDAKLAENEHGRYVFLKGDLVCVNCWNSSLANLNETLDNTHYDVLHKTVCTGDICNLTWDHNQSVAADLFILEQRTEPQTVKMSLANLDAVDNNAGLSCADQDGIYAYIMKPIKLKQ